MPSCNATHAGRKPLRPTLHVGILEPPSSVQMDGLTVTLADASQVIYRYRWRNAPALKLTFVREKLQAAALPWPDGCCSRTMSWSGSFGKYFLPRCSTTWLTGHAGSYSGGVVAGASVGMAACRTSSRAAATAISGPASCAPAAGAWWLGLVRGGWGCCGLRGATGSLADTVSKATLYVKL
jgi:hypothetical protein